MGIEWSGRKHMNGRQGLTVQRAVVESSSMGQLRKRP